MQSPQDPTRFPQVIVSADAHRERGTVLRSFSTEVDTTNERVLSGSALSTTSMEPYHYGYILLISHKDTRRQTGPLGTSLNAFKVSNGRVERKGDWKGMR